MKATIKRLVPKRLKVFVKGLKKGNKLRQLLAPAMPPLVCVDVGASYFPHGKWRLFLESGQTAWIAVEPNEQNLGYLKSWSWRSKVSACTKGLSRDGGKKTLYVTNVDSGSSLLEPVVNDDAKHRFRDLNYFFPMKKVEIDTLSLPQLFAMKDGQLPAGAVPVFMKLDTQGTELSILQGAGDLLDANRVVGIEMESTLAANPVMKGSGRFWEAMQFLESKNLELLDLDPIASPSRYGVRKNRGKTYFAECDAVFAMKRTTAQRLGMPYMLALLGLYVSYQFYEEALTFLDDDAGLSSALSAAGVDLQGLRAMLSALL